MEVTNQQEQQAAFSSKGIDQIFFRGSTLSNFNHKIVINISV